MNTDFKRRCTFLRNCVVGSKTFGIINVIFKRSAICLTHNVRKTSCIFWGHLCYTKTNGRHKEFACYLLFIGTYWLNTKRHKYVSVYACMDGRTKIPLRQKLLCMHTFDISQAKPYIKYALVIPPILPCSI